MSDPASMAAGASQTPSLRRRMACLVYEALILFGLGLIPGALGALFVALSGQQHPLQSETALRVYTFFFYGAYFVWFWSQRGQTLPMQTWHIKLLAANGQPPSALLATARFLAACAWFVPAVAISALNGWTRWQSLGAVLVGIVVYALLALLHPQRQFWHDALCGTRLVTHRPEPRPAAA